MYKLDIYKVESKVVDGYTVVDENAKWELVEIIEAETAEQCLAKANYKYDPENYHWVNPYYEGPIL